MQRVNFSEDSDVDQDDADETGDTFGNTPVMGYEDIALSASDDDLDEDEMDDDEEDDGDIEDSAEEES